jgi:uncharacterized membrane protein YdbT with pleckstrin-like domain
MISMENVTLHPSMKTVWFAYIVAILLIVAGGWAYYTFAPDKPAWFMALPLVFLLPPIKMHFERRMLSLRFHDDHLTLETGLFSRTRRTVDMAKIQDVTVKQSLGQRLLGVGDLMLESAGESGSMAIANIDRPRAIADAILNSSRRTPGRIF